MNESWGEGSVEARPHVAYEQGDELDLDQRHWEPQRVGSRWDVERAACPSLPDTVPAPGGSFLWAGEAHHAQDAF